MITIDKLNIVFSPINVCLKAVIDIFVTHWRIFATSKCVATPGLRNTALTLLYYHIFVSSIFFLSNVTKAFYSKHRKKVLYPFLLTKFNWMTGWWIHFQIERTPLFHLPTQAHPHIHKSKNSQRQQWIF